MSLNKLNISFTKFLEILERKKKIIFLKFENKYFVYKFSYKFHKISFCMLRFILCLVENKSKVMEKGGRKRERKIWYSIVWIEWKWREENLIFHCLLDFPPGLTIFVSFQTGNKISKKTITILFFSFPFASQTFFF